MPEHLPEKFRVSVFECILSKGNNNIYMFKGSKSEWFLRYNVGSRYASKSTIESKISNFNFLQNLGCFGHARGPALKSDILSI